MLNTLFVFIKQGGYQFMIPLIFLSVLSLAVILEKLFSSRFRVLPDKNVMDTIKESFAAGDTADLSSVLSMNNTLTAVIIKDILALQKKGVGLKEAVEHSAEHHIDYLNRRQWLLKAIGHLAPLIGLTGTVVGLAVAFSMIASEGISQQNVAGGIAMALNTTIAGLVVAMPTLFAEYIFRAWSEQQYKDLKHLLDSIVVGAKQL